MYVGRNNAKKPQYKIVFLRGGEVEVHTRGTCVVEVTDRPSNKVLASLPIETRMAVIRHCGL